VRSERSSGLDEWLGVMFALEKRSLPGIAHGFQTRLQRDLSVVLFDRSISRRPRPGTTLLAGPIFENGQHLDFAPLSREQKLWRCIERVKYAN
jgi:hypothetical protein